MVGRLTFWNLPRIAPRYSPTPSSLVTGSAHLSPTWLATHHRPVKWTFRVWSHHALSASMRCSRPRVRASMATVGRWGRVGPSHCSPHEGNFIYKSGLTLKWVNSPRTIQQGQLNSYTSPTYPMPSILARRPSRVTHGQLTQINV